MKILYIEKFKYRVREYNAQTNAIKLVEIIFIETQLSLINYIHTQLIHSKRNTCSIHCTLLFVGSFDSCRISHSDEHNAEAKDRRRHD